MSGRGIASLLWAVALFAGCSDEGPTEPPAGESTTIVSLAAGALHTCALDDGGAVYCWGQPTEVGVEFQGGSNGPVRVELPGAASTIEAGANATCATLVDGARWCWGDVAGLGDPAILPRRDTALASGPDVAFGSNRSDRYRFPHRCVIDDDGAAECIGGNDALQLGSGDEQSYRVDVARPVAGGHRWTALGGGYRSTCGVSDDRKLMCWGEVAPASGYDTVPRNVVEPYWDELEWREVGLGAGFACGLAVSAGGEEQAFCWNFGTTATIGGAPFHGLTNPGRGTAISVGRDHVCLIDFGRVLCFGSNDHGQLGSGDRVATAEPALVPGRRDWVDIAAGARHTCALNEAGAVYCWGANDRGQMADDDVLDRLQPVHISFEAVRNSD